MKLPDMHRISDRKADWEHIPPETWNQYQRRAAETNGIDTPGNRETLKGLLLSFAGLASIAKKRYTAGAVLLGVGRYHDIRDGKKADSTGTKGPVGEAFDAVGDNILVAVAVPIFVKEELLSPEEAAAMGGVVAIKFVSSGIARARRREEHASRIAKYGQLAQWIGMGGRVIERVCENYDFPRVTEAVGTTADAALRTGIGMSAMGGLGYTWTALRPESDA